MKKITSLLLVSALLITVLTGCSKTAENTDAAEQTTNFAPEATSEVPTVIEEDIKEEPVQEELPEVIDVPVEITPEPATEATPEPAPTQDNSLATYTFQTLSDTSFGFVFTYPTTWVNSPGKHTVCFSEPAEEGSVPARVAITRKEMVHKPDAERVLEQFKEYGEVIKGQYEAKTFEWGTLNEEARFMGNTAYEIPYLAYSGDTEIQGYLACTAVDYTIYVFHFYCPYDEYGSLKNLMTMMRDSVKVVE